MKKLGRPFTVLGIETSCDDTAVAIVSSCRKILGQVIIGQQSSHQPYNGIVPKIASQLHRANLPLAINRCFVEAGLSGLGCIDAIAATQGPGLSGSLSAGFLAGRSIAAASGLPFYGIHHMEGHALTSRLSNKDLKFPFLGFLISGGHTLLLLVHGVGQYTILGSTIDDSVGEALDKATVMLRIPWLKNEGPAAALERIARSHRSDVPGEFRLPTPLREEARKTLDFSFSGIKTALKYHINSLGALDDFQRSALAFEFQRASTEHLEDRLTKALEMPIGISSVVISGGVAKNQFIRNKLTAVCQKVGVPVVLAPFDLCSDNAVMIAWAAIENIEVCNPPIDPLEFVEVKPVWPLDELKLINRKKQ